MFPNKEMHKVTHNCLKTHAAMHFFVYGRIVIIIIVITVIMIIVVIMRHLNIIVVMTNMKVNVGDRHALIQADSCCFYEFFLQQMIICTLKLRCWNDWKERKATHQHFLVALLRLVLQLLLLYFYSM